MTPAAPNPPAFAPALPWSELLVVIGIILILLGLLFPAIAAVRRQAMAAATKAEMSKIQAACQTRITWISGRIRGQSPSRCSRHPRLLAAPIIPGTPSYTLQGINGSPQSNARHQQRKSLPWPIRWTELPGRYGHRRFSAIHKSQAPSRARPASTLLIPSRTPPMSIIRRTKPPSRTRLTLRSDLPAIQAIPTYLRMPLRPTPAYRSSSTISRRPGRSCTCAPEWERPEC